MQYPEWQNSFIIKAPVILDGEKKKEGDKEQFSAIASDNVGKHSLISHVQAVVNVKQVSRWNIFYRRKMLPAHAILPMYAIIITYAHIIEISIIRRNC